MSLYEYVEGLKIAARDSSFYALIQAAVRRADTADLKMLKESWPEIWEELEARDNTLDGQLRSELKGDEK